MSKWEMVRLGDVGVIITGNTPRKSDLKNYETNDIPFYKPGDFIEGRISSLRKAENNISTYAKKSARILPQGSVLVTCIGIIGKIGVIQEESACNQQINAIIPDEIICFNRYLSYAILHINKSLNDIANSAVVPIINKSQFSNIIIPLPPLDIQKKIAAALDTANALIEKRKEQIEKLDLLIKSQFIEMFGDPVTNPKGWERTPMGKYIALLTDFSANGSYEYLDSNIVMSNEPGYALMVRTTDLEKNDFEKDVKYIDIKAYEILKKSKLFGNEIIINKIGSAGKVYIMPVIGKPASLGRNAFMIRYKSDINIKFIYYLLVSRYGEREIQKHIRGAVTKTITKEAVKSIQILCPPLYLQTQFAEFVEKVEAQKTLLQKSLADMEQNYQSLLQKCFKGEIF